MSTSTFTRARGLYLTFGLMLFCFSSITAGRVVITLYALHLGASPSTVGTLVASQYVFPLLVSWPVGRYSDRVGSRALLAFGTAVGFVAMLVPYFVPGLPSLYVASVLLGLSFTLYNVLLQNLLGLLSKPEALARNISNASLIGAVTNFAGPMVGGAVIDLASHAIACVFLSILPLVAAILLVVWGGLLPGGSRQLEAAGSIRGALANREMRKIFVTSSLVQVAQDLYQFYIPVYGYAIGLSASSIGVLLGLIAAASFVVRVALPRLIARFGEETVLAYSFGFVVIGFVLTPLFENMALLGVVCFLFGLGMGCGQPITTMLIFARAAPGRSGETLGLRQSVNNVLRVSAPTVFGFIATAFGLPAVFVISGAIMAGGGLLARPQRAAKR